MRAESSVAITSKRQGNPADLQGAGQATAMETEPPTSAVAAGLTVESMLGDLPTAHKSAPIGHRLAGQGCHGTATAPARTIAATPTRMPRVARVRFVYFPVQGESDRRADYHRHLVIAEVLLDRVLAARKAGLRPMLPAMDYAAEARATLPPPRALFHAATLEYRRWYADDGAVRAQPLTQEALAAQLVVENDLSMEEARHRAAHHSHALAATDQAWLIERRNAALECRPLNQAEFQLLVGSLEGAWQVPGSDPHLEHANRQIAVRVAALLGGLLDEFVASPFQTEALSRAFSEVHFAHLRQTIEISRRAESASGALLAGPKAWFAAKAARMRAEHQIGLAMSPGGGPDMQLNGRPVLAVLGGKLRTYMNGSRVARSGARLAVDALRSA